MIVRILGDAQYEIADEAVEHLTSLDTVVEQALEAGDEPRFHTALHELIAEVKSHGVEVDPTTIRPSDLVLPHEDAGLDEVRELLASEEVDSQN